VQAILRQIGVALELPFEFLIKHFTASYSASRAALLEAWRFDPGAARVARRPTSASRLRGGDHRGRRARLPRRARLLRDPLVRRAWLGARWVGDAPGQIDPLSEIEAAEKRVDMGVSTLAEETAQLTGGDWERKHHQRVKETRLRREARGRADPHRADDAPAARRRARRRRGRRAGRARRAGAAWRPGARRIRQPPRVGHRWPLAAPRASRRQGARMTKATI
jgi:capsid protein